MITVLAYVTAVILGFVLPDWVLGPVFVVFGLLFFGFTDHGVLARVFDASMFLFGVWLIVDWWRRKGKRRWAARLAGYKARAIQATMRRRMGEAT